MVASVPPNPHLHDGAEGPSARYRTDGVESDNDPLSRLFPPVPPMRETPTSEADPSTKTKPTYRKKR